MSSSHIHGPLSAKWCLYFLVLKLSRFVITFLPRSKHLSCLQSPFTMILKPKKIKSVTVSTVSPFICQEVMRLDAMILVFWMLHSKAAFSLSSFTFIKKLFSSSSLSAIRVVSSIYLRLLIFLLAILILAWASCSLTFHIMYSAYNLNKQGDNIQPWCIPFPILNQSVIPCLVLTVASYPAYRLLRGQVRWSGITISLSEWVKVTQSCLTLCDPMDFTVHGILQARILEWVTFPFSKDLPKPGIEPRSPALQTDSLPAEPQGKPPISLHPTK